MFSYGFFDPFLDYVKYLSGVRVVSRFVGETFWRRKCGCSGRVGEEGVLPIELVTDALKQNNMLISANQKYVEAI